MSRVIRDCFFQTSLLQLLLKELPAKTGTININGNMSYSCQESWLFPATVRENILFGLPYEPEKYKRVCVISSYVVLCILLVKTALADSLGNFGSYDK